MQKDDEVATRSANEKTTVRTSSAIAVCPCAMSVRCRLCLDCSLARLLARLVSLPTSSTLRCLPVTRRPCPRHRSAAIQCSASRSCTRAHICVCVRTWMLKYTWMLKDHCRLLQVRVARTAGNQAFREGMQAYTGVCACMRACTYACICACVREPGMKMA